MPLHQKFNVKIADPNPHFTFISVLKEYNDSDAALKLLRALAAQVKPVCKKNHLYVNSFEEAAWNPEWGGRNWNAGECIEIVLRGPKGQFLPLPWLVHVVCHELAHCQQMNHSAAFNAVNNRFRSEVADLRARGYYGDGMWSDGYSLLDGTRVAPASLATDNLPQLLCGGASKRKRPNFHRSRHTRKRAYQVVKPGSAGGVVSGRKGPKAGNRLKRTLPGEGQAIDDDPSHSTFRKRAQTKTAREIRADAAERRLAAASTAKEEEEDTDALHDAPDDFDEDQDLNAEESDSATEDEGQFELTVKEKKDLAAERADALRDLATKMPSPVKPPASLGKGKRKAPVSDSATENSDDGSKLPAKPSKRSQTKGKSPPRTTQKRKQSTSGSPTDDDSDEEAKIRTRFKARPTFQAKDQRSAKLSKTPSTRAPDRKSTGPQGPATKSITQNKTKMVLDGSDSDIEVLTSVPIRPKAAPAQGSSKNPIVL